MRRVLLTAVHDFHPAVAEAVSAAGVEPVLFFASERDSIVAPLCARFPNVPIITGNDFDSGQMPRGGSVPPVASADDLSAIEPVEGMVLQMLDRRNAGGASVQELRSHVRRMTGMWGALLGAHRPDAAILQATPHRGHDLILHRLCEHRGIVTRIVERTSFDRRLFFRRTLAGVPAPTDAEVDTAVAAGVTVLPPAGVLADVNAELNDYRLIQQSLSVRSVVRAFITRGTLLHPTRPVVDLAHNMNGGAAPEIVHRWREAAGRYLARKCLRFYHSRASSVSEGVPFVYFPLHFQPERTTVPDAGVYSDQLHVLDTLLAGLPAGWRVLVREHPRQFNLSRGIRGVTWNRGRSESFYRRLVADPRVTLARLDVPSTGLIAQAACVLAITGTSGWEAVAVGKPVLLFGNPWYGGCPGIDRVRSVADVSRVLTALAVAPESAEVQRARAARAAAFASVLCERYTFAGCFNDQLLARSGMTVDANASNYAEAIARELKEPTR